MRAMTLQLLVSQTIKGVSGLPEALRRLLIASLLIAGFSGVTLILQKDTPP